MLEASKSTGISVTNISACVKNKRQKDGKGHYYITKSAGGFVWKTKETVDD